ncbi:cobalt/zinc/cadmium resistance heavy metal efflux pump protein CzcA [Acetobacter nitrogenifigens DSM 23921 = NBRC 105050]|uniref:Cation transporter n=1 Tax=Acetobacter nitrogenifigens DSM 23921 = NBRC 105050 TaxID=1120919 RepID=A0A511X654_9PROT|nr:CusA/CzcA family heavy metal efflux RND transporter [Acetobacter nitrogenifigens]GBQ96169.1 cobalt/zinc/cadmium resistance heavy metal efflux pump protein CzcA [Acetobacter nitrogenifigens DSM 23921 = NBRC 105050]GEN58420.1 cation transporter [Acetobacter nitrogenifigens DSM 23921 = NBRC 105050]
MKFVLGLLSRRRAVLGAAVLLMIVGVFDLRSLAVEPVPDISPRQVLVSVSAPGLPTQEVERLVTLPVETVLSGVVGLDTMRSVSRTGVSVLYLQFGDNTNIYRDRELVSQRLAEARDAVPIHHVSISMGPMTTGMGEIMHLQILGPGRSLAELNRIMTWSVVPKLRLVPGVVDVNVNGGAAETYEVELDPQTLRRYGVSAEDVFDAVDTGNEAAGGAWIEHNDEQRVIVGRSLIDSLDELGAIEVRSGPNGEAIHVRDLGAVHEGRLPRLGAVTRDGEGEIVNAVVLLREGANARQALARIKKALPELNRSLPQGVRLVPYYSRSTLTNVTIMTVRDNLLMGAALVFVVLMAVIGDWRAALVIISVIPFSLLVAMVGMNHLGISANLLSLGAIDFGMIVDSALVIVETVLSRRPTPGMSFAEGIAATVSLIARPVTFAILIIILVYLPILTLEGIEGRMFRPMAETVILGLLASLAFALVCVPPLCLMLMKPPAMHENHAEADHEDAEHDDETGHDTRLIAFLRRGFLPASRYCVANTGRVTLVALAIFAVSALLATRLGGEFIPQLQEGDLIVTSTRLPGISLEASVRAVNAIENTLKRFPEIRTLVSNTGTSAIPTDPQGGEQTDTYILLKSRSEWRTADTQEGLVRAFDEALRKYNPGSLYNWSQPIQMRMDDLQSGVRSQIAVGVYGPDLKVLTALTAKIAQVIAAVPGAADVAPQDVGTIPYLHIDVDRQAVARLNVPTSEVLDVVESIGGHVGPPVSLDAALIPTEVRIEPSSRDTLEKIRLLPVVTRDDHVVDLSQVAHITLDDGPAAIRRIQGERRMMVQANVRGRDLASFVSAAQAAVAKDAALPPGYRVEWSGQFKNLQTASARLAVVVPITLGLIFLLLILALGDPWLAGLVFVNLPFAATGGVIAIWLRGMPFSISAGIGFIALFGVATLNGVVLISWVKEKRRNGMDAFSAATTAARERFRPVMATASVACLGFFPMAFSMSEGAEVEKPLATVVIGGLVSCTALTLLVLPSLYIKLSHWRERRAPGR